jgi:hypothetical protein
MVFVVNGQGVPSLSRWIRIGVPQAADDQPPQVAPVTGPVAATPRAVVVPKKAVTRDRVKPSLSKLKIVFRKGRWVVTFRLSEKARVTPTLQRLKPGKAAKAKVTGQARTLATRIYKRGPVSITLGRLSTGRWRLTLRLRDMAGNRRNVVRAFTVRPRR